MSLDDIPELISKLFEVIDTMSPLTEVMEAKKKLRECKMWLYEAFEADK